MRLGIVDEGCQRLADAVAARPENAAFHQNYGVALVRLGALQAAEREFAAAMRLDGSNDSFRRSLVKVRAMRLATTKPS